jgi:hypothetical protein
VRWSGAWLFSRRVDVGVFLGSAIVAIAALAVGRAAGVLDGDAPDWAWVPGVLLVDVAHVWSTGFRFDRAELRARPTLYAAVPLACFAAGVALYARGGSALFWRSLAYVAAFHFVRQQYGWVKLYRAKAGETDAIDGALDAITVYAATLYPLVHWHTHLPRAFHWFIGGDFVALPLALDAALRPLYFAILAVYVARAIVSAARGAPINLGKHIVVATTAVCWWIGIVTFDSDYAFTVTNVLIHGVPYFALVHTYRARAMKKRTPLAAMLGVVWMLAFVEELMWDRAIWHERGWIFGPPWSLPDGHKTWLVPLLALPQATHYVLDGFLWKRRRDVRLRTLAEAAPAPAE